MPNAADVLRAEGIQPRPNLARIAALLRDDLVKTGRYTREEADFLSDDQAVDAYVGRKVDLPNLRRSAPVLTRDFGRVLGVR